MPILDSPKDRHRSIYATIDFEKALDPPILVVVGPLDLAPVSFHFSDPIELALPIPYPTTIIENTPDLCYRNIHSEPISPVLAWQHE